MPLDPTVGGPNANAYCDLIYYKNYLATRLPAPSWIASALAGTIDSDLEANLIAGRRALDNSFMWAGWVATGSQALDWPRNGMLSKNGVLIPNNVIPNGVKDANCEYGTQLRLGDWLNDDEAARANVKRVKASSVEVEFQSTSDSADETITKLGPEFDYIRAPSEVRRLLVPSWYTRETALYTNEIELNVF